MRGLAIKKRFGQKDGLEDNKEQEHILANITFCHQAPSSDSTSNYDADKASSKSVK